MFTGITLTLATWREAAHSGMLEPRATHFSFLPQVTAFPGCHGRSWEAASTAAPSAGLVCAHPGGPADPIWDP